MTQRIRVVTDYVIPDDVIVSDPEIQEKAREVSDNGQVLIFNKWEPDADDAFAYGHIHRGRGCTICMSLSADGLS